ncbi:carboxymuconolactone decarboxylase family protein [Myxococcota bacterium]|nr:carboxymuconolactone decarboxylase family protein [Myxococcota bacterium]
MSSQRIQMLDPTEAQKIAVDMEMPAAFADLNIFQTLFHNPALGKAIGELLLTLLFKSSLDHRLRELVIMRIGWSTASEYEWTQHWGIALEQFGCSREDLLEVRHWRESNHFGASERAVLMVTDEIIESGTVTDETWQACAEALPEEVTRVELVASVGCWHLISQVTRSLDIPLEDGVVAWPPDGQGPLG